MPAPYATATPLSTPLAVTMGEPGGVGPEITAAAWRYLRAAGPVFFLIGDPGLFTPFETPITPINHPSEAASIFANALPVLAINEPVSARPGVASPENAPAVIAAIREAVALTLSGVAAGVVTNPIQKSSLMAAGFPFPGHTEYLAELTKDVALPDGMNNGPVMMLAGPALKSVPVTIHQSVAEAVKGLSASLIENTGRVVEQSLRRDFGVAAPRLAISGLNPHAGEGGAIGREDLEIIAPAVDALQKAGINAIGPLPADTMFHDEARAGYDAALCMLHDQALIPAKTLAFHDAVNITLGLPIVRTSPDHGTAVDIAGQGIARPDSLIAAITLAAKIGAARERFS